MARTGLAKPLSPLTPAGARRGALRALSVFVLALTGLLHASLATAAPVAPTMSGDISAPECSDALLLAAAMFNARSSRLYAPLNIPGEMDSELILGATEMDLSGGAALKASEDQFEAAPYSEHHVYWEKNPQTGSLIVMTEKPAPDSWRGNMYNLYLLDVNVSREDFIEYVLDNRWSTFEPLIYAGFRPPLVFLHKPSQRKWILEVGDSHNVLPDWLVYKETAGTYSSECAISFQPKGTSAFSLLPKAVRNLARLLNETMGPEIDEGALRPAERQRRHMRNVWANAAVRPWALSESDTHNSTEEVRAGLLQWSKTGRSYKRVYNQILRAYPAAQRALAAYYAKRFQLPKNKAKKTAEWILDIAFRANYVFPNESDYFRYDNVNTNPW